MSRRAATIVRHARGMTLVELMVTLAVVALLLLAVIPDIGAWMRNTQIRNATESIQAGLMKARNEAVKRNRTVQFSLVSLADPAVMDNSCALSATSGSWVVSMADPSGRCATAVSDTVNPMIIDTHPVADGGRNVSITALQADGASAATTAAFDAFGRVVSAAPIARVDVTLALGGVDLRPLRIEITSNGSIRTCDPHVNSAADPRHCLLP